LAQDEVLGLKPRSPREPRPDSKQQLNQKRDHRPLLYHTPTSASSRIGFSGGTAIRDKPGRLEGANGATVFLDEIADLSAPLQAKFLRFVQERSFERVGGEKTIHVDARIVAASNRDLAAEVTARHFREDLFYRLNVISLRVPPLRERAEDLLPLVDVLLSGASVRNRRARLSFSPEAQAVISNYPWPGNVRELRNAVERAVVLSQSDLIGPECLPDSLFQPRSKPRPPLSLPASRI
jgi:transcriptional regulator with GAF, ATPase, and Fis domain